MSPDAANQQAGFVHKHSDRRQDMELFSVTLSRNNLNTQ